MLRPIFEYFGKYIHTQSGTFIYVCKYTTASFKVYRSSNEGNDPQQTYIFMYYFVCIFCVCVCVCVWMSISSHQKNSFNLFFEPPHLAATPLGGRHKFINRRPIETKFTRGDTNLYCFKQMCNCLRNLGIVTSYI